MEGEGRCGFSTLLMDSSIRDAGASSTDYSRARMFDFCWLTMRQAKEAIKNGRPEEAQRLLAQPAAQGHKRSWELLQQVGEAFLERGRQHYKQESLESAWNDLLAAEQAGQHGDAVAQLRMALAKRGLAEARGLLERGDPTRAGEILHRLRGRMVQQPELETLEEAAKNWTLAREQAGRGEFTRALQTSERIAACLPTQTPVLAGFRNDLERNAQSFFGLLESLHEAIEKKQWRDVVRLSEQVLAMAPHHFEARKARARAWRVIDPQTVGRDPQQPATPARAAAVEPAPGARFLLWIDGVGGYLVCLRNQVALGQATADATVDIPVFADVSRVHANLTRESEGYLLEAVRPLLVNGKGFQKGPVAHQAIASRWVRRARFCFGSRWP